MAEGSNSFRYMRLLNRCAEGRCLWYPTTVGAIGDVGFVRDGYFNKLFNVFEAPNPLPSLSTSPSTAPTETRNNSHMAWMVVDGGAHTVGATGPAATDVVTLGFEFSSARSDGAFLIPGGRARRVSRYLKENTFVDYLLEHCDLILSMYSEYPWDECSLMILKGTTRSIAWGRGLTTQTARGVAGHISISVPAIGIPMLSLDVSHHRAALQHWLIECGPAESSEEADPVTSDYCIIIKPVIIRLRDKLKYRMKALLSTRTSAPNPQKTVDYFSSGRLPHLQPNQSRGTIAAPRTEFMQLDAASTGNVDALLSEDDMEPPDDLEAVLDAILEDQPEVDAIVGDWDMLLETEGQHIRPGHTRKLDYILNVSQKDHGQVAALATLARCPSLLSSPTGDTGSSEWEHALSATNSAEVVTADLSRATSDSHPPAAVLDGEIDSSDQHSEKASPEMSPLIDIHRKRIFDPSVTARFMPNYINANRLTQTDLHSQHLDDQWSITTINETYGEDRLLAILHGNERSRHDYGPAAYPAKASSDSNDLRHAQQGYSLDGYYQLSHVASSNTFRAGLPSRSSVRNSINSLDGTYPSHLPPKLSPLSLSTLDSSFGGSSVTELSITSLGPSPRPLPRLKEDLRQETEDSHGVTVPERKIVRACNHCRKFKMKCDYQPGADRCERCIKKRLMDCRVTERRKAPGPSARERLLHELRAKDQLIASLLRQISKPDTVSVEAPRFSGPISGLARRTLPDRGPGASGSIGETLAWELGITSNGENNNEDETSSDCGDEEFERRDLARAAMQALPAESYPLGLISRLSLGEEVSVPVERAITDIKMEDDYTNLLDTVAPKIDDAGTSVVPNNDFRTASGPASSMLAHGIVTFDEVEELFSNFYQTINPALSILDEALHTPSSVRKRCLFLFTVICASSARYYTKQPHLYKLLNHFAKQLAASVFTDGLKSVEICQAYIILGCSYFPEVHAAHRHDHASPASRRKPSQPNLYNGLAIRMAKDLNLHQPSQTRSVDEQSVRESRNRTRVWLVCHNIDRSAITLFGRAETLPGEGEVPAVNSSTNWYLEPYAHPFDVHLCGYSALLRIMTQFLDSIREHGATVRLEDNDYLAITRRFEEQLDAFFGEWSEKFEQYGDKKDQGVASRTCLLPILVSYCKLVMYSFGIQQYFDKGLASVYLFFNRGWNAATSVVQGMVEMEPSFLRNTAECHRVLGVFANVFLFKLLRPEFAAAVDHKERQSILNLTMRLADALEESAIDDAHSSRLYARLLHELAWKQSALPPETLLIVQHGHSGSSNDSITFTERTLSRNWENTSPDGWEKSSRTKRAGGSPSGASDKDVLHVTTSDSQTSSPDSTDINKWPSQMRLSAPVELTSLSPLARLSSPMSSGPSFSTSTQQQPVTRNFYPSDPNATYSASLGFSGMGMDVDDADQMLLPLRALTNPAFSEHMLLPGWMQPQPQIQTASQTKNTMGGSTGVRTSPTDSGMSLEELNAAIFGLDRTHALPTQPTQPLQQNSHYFSGQ